MLERVSEYLGFVAFIQLGCKTLKMWLENPATVQGFCWDPYLKLAWFVLMQGLSLGPPLRQCFRVCSHTTLWTLYSLFS